MNGKPMTRAKNAGQFGLMALFALGLCTHVAMANMAGTKHDFSTTSWAGGEICLPCHTPHGGNKLVAADAPLWNHAITTATYTPYSTAWMNSVSDQPDGVSKLCLSCHDGTVALDSYSRMTGTTTIGTVRTDRRSSHPI